MAVLAAQTVIELYDSQWSADCVVNQEITRGWRW
jgi:hypothetical protein